MPWNGSGSLLGTGVSIAAEDRTLVDSGLSGSPVNYLQFTYPHGCFLRARGLAYFGERRREFWRWVGSVAFVSVVGGFFAGAFSVAAGMLRWPW